MRGSLGNMRDPNHAEREERERCVQALEALRKLKAEKQQQAKMFKLKVEHLKTHKDNAGRLNEEKDGNVQRAREAQDKIAQLQQDIQARRRHALRRVYPLSFLSNTGVTARPPAPARLTQVFGRIFWSEHSGAAYRQLSHRGDRCRMQQRLLAPRLC